MRSILLIHILQPVSVVMTTGCIDVGNSEGRTGMMQLLPAIASQWEIGREDIVAQPALSAPVQERN